MWSLRGARPLGLVACMAGVLILFGASQLDAKKPPKPPKVQWEVAIPSADAGLNLFAAGVAVDGFVTFENSDAIRVNVYTEVDPETQDPYTLFSLTIAETPSIGFQNLDFQGCRTMCDKEGGGCDCGGPCLCQVLPGSEVAVDCCYVDCCSTSGIPCGNGYEVMKFFMEHSLHPTAGYDNFTLRFKIYADIDSIVDGVPLEDVDADLWRLNLWNTDEILVDGNEDDHNVVCASWIPLEDVVVVRSGDEWTVTVDQCGLTGNGCPASDYGHSGRYVVFWETYYQGIWKPIGKSGKFSLDSEYRWALGSATPFKFVTKWTRN